MRWQIAREARHAELAITTPYLTSASGIAVLLKRTKKYYKNMLFDFAKETSRRFISVISGAWFNGWYLMAAQPIKILELRIHSDHNMNSEPTSSLQLAPSKGKCDKQAITDLQLTKTVKVTSTSCFKFSVNLPVVTNPPQHLTVSSVYDGTLKLNSLPEKLIFKQVPNFPLDFKPILLYFFFFFWLLQRKDT